MKTVVVIDYGMGNLHSVAKALEHVATEHKIVVSSDPAQILAAERVVLPGVGAIRDCVGELRRLGLDKVLVEVVLNKPLLAVCVGMQVLLEFSAENSGTECLGVLPGRLDFFGETFAEQPPAEHLKVPHMGWNNLVIDQPHPVLDGVNTGDHAYFVHSYKFEVANPAHRLAHVEYGSDVTAIIGRDNMLGMQFHPEKSQSAGLRLISNFLNWTP